MPRDHDPVHATPTPGVAHRPLGEGRLPAAEAVPLLRAAVRAAPRSAPLLNDLGAALGTLGRWDEALAAFDAAAALAPRWAVPRRHRGVVFAKRGRAAEAAAAYRAALRLDPSDAETWADLTAALHALGDTPSAIDCRRQFVRLRPADAAAHSDLLLTLHYDPAVTRAELFAEHLDWAAAHTAGLPQSPSDYPNDRNPDRPIRVGYVSRDFREHPVGRFISPLLRGHDRRQVSVLCYADVRRPDAATRAIREAAERGPGDRWRDVTGRSDAEVAAAVRADQVDVLVDLGGHAGGRLPAFACRPAPVQVTYLGYPDTTGLAAIDYRLTDAVLDPDGEGDQYHTEERVRLPGGCWCYELPAEAPPVGPLPALARGGGVTFGVLNRLAKVSLPAATAWARVLAAVPDSRLLVCGGPGRGGPTTAVGLAAAWGVPADRVTVVPPAGLAGYLRTYHEVDLALDPFPCNGHTTTCDALWMGVPTVTLAGDGPAARLGASTLAAAGVAGFTARTADEYVALAAVWASDLRRLADLRARLRGAVGASALADGPRLAAEVERAYRRMWRGWCAGPR